MLNLILISLTIIALQISYKKCKKENFSLIEWFCLITTMTNIFYLFYLIYKVLSIENNYLEQNLLSILVPNIVLMSLTYWIVLAPNIKNNIHYSTLYLHLFSALFVVFDYIQKPIELKYSPNLCWFIFIYVMLYLNRIITGKWSYNNLTNINKTHFHLITFPYMAISLIIIRVNNHLLEKSFFDKVTDFLLLTKS